MSPERPGHMKWEADHFTGATLKLTLRLSCLLKFVVLFPDKGRYRYEWQITAKRRKDRTSTSNITECDLTANESNIGMYADLELTDEHRRKKPWGGQLDKVFFCSFFFFSSDFSIFLLFYDEMCVQIDPQEPMARVEAECKGKVKRMVGRWWTQMMPYWASSCSSKWLKASQGQMTVMSVGMDTQRVS